ncbi:hypothetical protein TNCT_113361 [Trichonephila clavata]|uniref:Uncharacterized protein n=1 Tax=Trichonephila clavata TaxID=2740835 RepID=A0A8X6I998_TRICU|nr:hypothetical protein TNCT_113361 [Trichonephila clavata]
MSHILKESAKLELPIGPGIPIPDNVMEACSNIYWANTTWEYFNRLVEILKSKINTTNMDPTSNTDKNNLAKERKREEKSL